MRHLRKETGWKCPKTRIYETFEEGTGWKCPKTRIYETFEEGNCLKMSQIAFSVPNRH